MNAQTLTRTRHRTRRPVAVTKPGPSVLLLFGAPARVRRIETALDGLLDVELSSHTKRPTPDARTLGIVVVTPLVGGEDPAHAVEAIRETRHGRALPIFVVVANDTPDRSVRGIYAAGATAVFHWPREALLLPRLVAELLGIALVRGRGGGPRSALTRTVKAYLRLIPWSTSGVRVSARSGGEVQLSGTIDTFWRKRELVGQVSRIPGVRRIESTQLNVSGPARPDRKIAQAVRSTLRNTAGVDPATVSVAVSGGTVALAGTVSDRGELDRILDLVSHVSGVRGLKNTLVVSGEARRKDGATAQRLNGALSKWFPGERVSIAVFSRVAVLSGKVRGLSRRNELERFVNQDPAITRVINKIDVA